ncbi:hypothetical protein HDU76_007471, partial [Blyttiomyces sp. JEL0837]
SVPIYDATHHFDYTAFPKPTRTPSSRSSTNTSPQLRTTELPQNAIAAIGFAMIAKKSKPSLRKPDSEYRFHLEPRWVADLGPGIEVEERGDRLGKRGLSHGYDDGGLVGGYQRFSAPQMFVP